MKYSYNKNTSSNFAFIRFMCFVCKNRKYGLSCKHAKETGEERRDNVD